MTNTNTNTNTNTAPRTNLNVNHIDIRYGRKPADCVHVPGLRLAATCRSLGIPFAPALVGWAKRGRYPAKKVLDGVVVYAPDENALLDGLDRRDARRKSPEERRAAAAKRRESDRARRILGLADALRERFPGMPSTIADAIAEHQVEDCGRSYSAWTRDDHTEIEDPLRAMAVAHMRHRTTDYDSLLAAGHEKSDARRAIGCEASDIVTDWEIASSRATTATLREQQVVS